MTKQNVAKLMGQRKPLNVKISLSGNHYAAHSTITRHHGTKKIVQWSE